jgi:hypothetical protein
LLSKRVASIALRTTATPKAEGSVIQWAYTDGVPLKTTATALMTTYANLDIPLW